MAERWIFPEWHKENDETKYPFAENATLVTRDQRTLLEGTFLDAHFYPIGGQDGMYLSKVHLDHDLVTLVIGDEQTTDLANGRFNLINPPDVITFQDSFGRPAGIMVSESRRLVILQSWGTGDHEFAEDASQFAATVCAPTPAIGLRGIQLEDGSLFTGDVWLVGDNGVVVRQDTVDIPFGCRQGPLTVPAVRIDIVGNPLFRRKLCTPETLFTTPHLVRRVRVLHAQGEFECGPDINGDIRMSVNNALAADTVLRVRTTSEGLIVEAVGTTSLETR